MPELERRGGDQARQLAGLEHLLDDQALLARERAVVGARRSPRSAQLVEAQREALGAAAVVDEHDRRAVLLGRAAAARGRSPARSTGASPRRRPPGRAGPRRPRLLGLDHRLDRHVDPEVERLAHAGVDDRARAPRADQEARRPPRAGSASRYRPMRCGSRVVGLSALEPLEREREVRAALGPGDGVDLVDDRPTRRRCSISRACEVRIRYSDSGVVMRMSGGVRRIAARSLCGVSPVRIADLSTSGADAAQRRAQVALDVVGQRLQRRDVDAAACAARPRARVRGQPVERPEERRERLARAGRRGDQHVLAGGDRRPRLRLGRRRRLERAARTSRGRAG